MIKPIPISQRTLNRLREHPEYKEHSVESVLGIKLRIISHPEFTKYNVPIPVYIQPLLDLAETLKTNPTTMPTKTEVEHELRVTKEQLKKAEERNTSLNLRLRIAHKVASVVLDELAPETRITGLENHMKELFPEAKKAPEENEKANDS